LVSIVAPSTTATFAVVSTASTDTSKAVTTLSAVVALPFAAATAASFATRAFSNTSSCASVSYTLLPRTVEMVAIPLLQSTNDWIAGKLLVVLTYFLFFKFELLFEFEFPVLESSKTLLTAS
jgi:hypothetical protein